MPTQSISFTPRNDQWLKAQDENQDCSSKCNDPAVSAQVRPLMRMPQRVFSYRGPDVAVGGC